MQWQSEAYRLIEHGDQQIEEQDHAQQEIDGYKHHHKPGIVLAAGEKIILVTACSVSFDNRMHASCGMQAAML